jgi:MFS family permease
VLNAKINKFQLKIMFVSGTGFFTDAYDPFVIGIVVALKNEWSLSTGQVSWINSATLLASAVGAIALRPLAGPLLGSVSQGAAATASCPVVLVKVTDQP